MMEPQPVNEPVRDLREDGSISIFDDLQPLPVYYSETAVSAFSFLFGVIFGSVLMAMNINAVPGKKGQWQVIVFGLLYTIVEVTTLSYLPKSNSGLTILFNIVGAQLLRRYFWGKYIGKDVRYTKRSVVVPAIIGIVLIVLFTFGIIASMRLPL